MAPRATTTKIPPPCPVERWADPTMGKDAEADGEEEETTRPAALPALEADPEAAAEFG